LRVCGAGTARSSGWSPSRVVGIPVVDRRREDVALAQPDAERALVVVQPGCSRSRPPGTRARRRPVTSSTRSRTSASCCAPTWRGSTSSPRSSSPRGERGRAHRPVA
jgi:hypothetical protein